MQTSTGTKSPRVVAVANQKGGVGKTTTAVNLAACLAAGKRKTLLIDLDPQGNASGGLGLDRHTSSTIYDVLIGRRELNECIQSTEIPDLFVIPSNQNLIGAEVELINAISREKKLKIALKKLPEDFEVVIFDCAPSLGLLTINAFTASDSILIPTQCEYYAMEGLGQLLSTFQIVKDDINEQLEIEGVLLTMFDPRNKLTHEVVKEMKSHFPEKLYETFIPRNVKLSESPSFGKPIVTYDPESKGCQAYIALAEEFLRRNNMGTLDMSAIAALRPKEEAAEPVVEAQETRVEAIVPVEVTPVEEVVAVAEEAAVPRETTEEPVVQAEQVLDSVIAETGVDASAETDARGGV